MLCGTTVGCDREDGYNDFLRIISRRRDLIEERIKSTVARSLIRRLAICGVPLPYLSNPNMPSTRFMLPPFISQSSQTPSPPSSL